VADRQREFPDANTRAKRLRREPTPAEKQFWQVLRKLPGFHFRRQLALGGYVFDFGDHGQRLLVELDGGIHSLPEVKARDALKDAAAVARGYRVVRIPNGYVADGGEYAIAVIMQAVRPNADSGER
jgi:very-short-patch-repair endonuclease